MPNPAEVPMPKPWQTAAKKPKKFHRMTGITPDEFICLAGETLPYYASGYLNARRKCGVHSKYESVEDVLFTTLLYYRTHMTMVLVGHIVGLSASNVCRWINKFRPILAQIGNLHKAPDFDENDLYACIVDCTEQRIQRPNKKGQKEYYSGKKKCHTIKTEVITDAITNKILSVSEPFPGSVHDLSVRKMSPQLTDSPIVLGDSAYQGLQHDHSNLLIPVKRKNGEISDEAKEYNKTLSQTRVHVEHTIGKIKIYRIIQEQYRCNLDNYGAVFMIVAMLVNFKAGFG